MFKVYITINNIYLDVKVKVYIIINKNIKVKVHIIINNIFKYES